MKSRVIPLVLILSLPHSLSASWLSNITGVDINIPAGTVQVRPPNPSAIPEMLRNLPTDVGQALLNPAGAALATAIRHGAAQARYSARPVPPFVLAALSPYIPAGILNKAQWAVYDPNRITIDSAITAWFQSEGAVTLDNVIVFSDSSTASSETLEGLELWAHELTHVMQYDNMGVESFATVYSVNWNSLEGQARSWASSIRSRLAQSQALGVQQATYYSVAPGTAHLSAQTYAEAARQFYPPESCTRTQETPQALWVRNICPIPINVTGWQQRNPYTGIVYAVPCVFNCGVGPGQTAPFQSPGPGPMVAVFYSY